MAFPIPPHSGFQPITEPLVKQNAGSEAEKPDDVATSTQAVNDADNANAKNAAGKSWAFKLQNSARPSATASTTFPFNDAPLASLLSRIMNHPGFSDERKERLAFVMKELRADFTAIGTRTRDQHKAMEGVTGVNFEEGRPSTDPDENMSIKGSAVVGRILREAATISVPDSANMIRTQNFLHAQGATVQPYEPGMQTVAGTMYMADMTSLEQMQAAARSKNGIDLKVLGPPMGHMTELLKGDVNVTIMGAGTLVDDKLSSLSTNMKDPKSETFVRDVLSMASKPKMISSGELGQTMTISLKELALLSDVLTPDDCRHWASNVKNQMNGLAPHHLLEKRFFQGGARVLFAETGTKEAGDLKTPLQLDRKGKGVSFLPLFNQVSQGTPLTSQLGNVVETLGDKYEFILQDGAADTSREKLRELAAVHAGGLKTIREKAAGLDEDMAPADRLKQVSASYAACAEAIDGMSDQIAINTFAATALAFKSIYDEKTDQGWQAKPGQQMTFASFSDSYVENGRQVPYDLLVDLEPIIRAQENGERKLLAADKALPILSVDLRESL